MSYRSFLFEQAKTMNETPGYQSALPGITPCKALSAEACTGIEQVICLIYILSYSEMPMMKKIHGFHISNVTAMSIHAVCSMDMHLVCQHSLNVSLNVSLDVSLDVSLNVSLDVSLDVRLYKS
jgi:hypothetical protein